jgi:hypothetical protein
MICFQRWLQRTARFVGGLLPFVKLNFGGGYGLLGGVALALAEWHGAMGAAAFAFVPPGNLTEPREPLLGNLGVMQFDTETGRKIYRYHDHLAILTARSCKEMDRWYCAPPEATA